MVSRAGGDAGGYVHVKMHKAKTPEMLKWHHRWLVANTEAAELQFFKNDQELIPKEVIPIPHVGRVTAGAGSDKAWTLDILTKNKNSSYTGCSVKVPTQDGQDVWIRVIRELMDGSYKGPDLRHRLRSAVERWRHTLSDITGGDVRLHIEESSFNTLPSEEFEHVNAFILGGQWFEGVDAFFREVRRSGQAAQTATGMHVADSVTRVHLRLDPLAPHGHARYDKISETLYIRLAWANNGAHRTLHSPNADALLSLVSTMWQLSLDKHIAQDPGWKAAHARLCALVGTPVPITLEWGPELQEDCTMLREYVGTWATEEYLDSITEAAAGCFDRDPPYEELQTWVGGVSLLIEKTAVQENKPPHVRIHRAPVRHDEDTGVELTKAMVTTFNKCRGVVTEHYSSLLCEAPMPDLKKEFSDALQHIYMAAMMRQAERITVGFDKMKLLFAINWDTFLATLNQLGVGPNPRLRLANQLLATSYPARVQTLTKAMDEQEWCKLCSIVNRVSVAFSCDATEHRSFLRGHELVDLCVVGKPEGQGGQSIVLSYSIKDLGSFCRGMLAVASQGETSPFLGNAMMHNPRLFDESTIDSERGLDEETERSEEYVAAAKNTFAQSFRSVANTENDSTYVRAHTQYANDSTIVLDKDIPQEIQNILMKQNSEDDEAYPVSLSLLEETSTALNRAFAKEGRIESDSKQHVIVHAIQKLRRIFSNYDPERRGTIEATHINEVIRAFHEYKHPHDEHNYAQFIRLIAPHGEGHVRFEKVARILMTRLFPDDVKTSLLRKRHCILLGLEQTGKSIILNALKSKTLEHTSPTIGERTEVVKIGGSIVSISEVGGSGDQLQNWSKYSKHANSPDGIAFVVDGAKPSTFELARAYLKDVLQSRHLRSKPLLLIVNNFSTRVNKHEVAKALKVEKYCKGSKRNFKVITTSFVSHTPPTDSAVEQMQTALTWLVRGGKGDL